MEENTAIKVSVVVPIYNVEVYLEEALNSLKWQTLKEMEFVCINDGSTDGSLEILKRYAAQDPRFVIIDKANGGYGVGMNVGISRARGEYIGILEPDDYVPCQMFEELYQVASENDLDFVKADFYRFATDAATGNLYMVYNHLDKTGTYYNRLLNPSESPAITKFTMNTWSGIYKRSFLNKYGIRHHETPGASFQDNGFFWQTFMYAERIMFVDKPYYRNRRDNPNSSVCNPRKVYAMNAEYDYIRELFLRPENRERWEIFKGWFNVKRYYNYEFTLGRIDQSFRKDYVNRISSEFRRARELGELDLSLMSEGAAAKVSLMIDHPDQYYKKYAVKMDAAFRTPEEMAARREAEVKEKLDAANKKLAAAKKCATWRVGEGVLWVPKKMKKAAKQMAKKLK